MSDLMTEIYSKVPALVRARTQLDAVIAEINRRIAESPRSNTFDTPHGLELRAMLEAGEPLDQLDQRVADRIALSMAAEAVSEALLEARARLTAAVQAGERDASTLLPLLGAAMAERVAEAESLAPFGEIMNADAAIASKRGDDAVRLTELLSDMVTLRRAQVRVLNGHNWGSKLSILLAIRNPTEAFADAAVWLRPGYLVHRTNRGETRQVVTPWPWPLQRDLTTPEFHLNALRNGWQLWIPTAAQFEQASQALLRKAAEPRPTDTREGDWVDPGPARPERPTNVRQRRDRDRPAAHVIS